MWTRDVPVAQGLDFARVILGVEKMALQVVSDLWLQRVAVVDPVFEEVAELF